MVGERILTDNKISKFEKKEKIKFTQIRSAIFPDFIKLKQNSKKPHKFEVVLILFEFSKLKAVFF